MTVVDTLPPCEVCGEPASRYGGHANCIIEQLEADRLRPDEAAAVMDALGEAWGPTFAPRHWNDEARATFNRALGKLAVLADAALDDQRGSDA